MNDTHVEKKEKTQTLDRITTSKTMQFNTLYNDYQIRRYFIVRILQNFKYVVDIDNGM